MDSFEDVVKILENCTRVEIITEEGREYVNIHVDNVVSMSLQDDRRTLKVFISREPIRLKEVLRKEIKLLNKMTEPKLNNVCSIDAIREQQSIVDEIVDKLNE